MAAGCVLPTLPDSTVMVPRHNILLKSPKSQGCDHSDFRLISLKLQPNFLLQIAGFSPGTNPGLGLHVGHLPFNHTTVLGRFKLV